LLDPREQLYASYFLAVFVKQLHIPLWTGKHVTEGEDYHQEIDEHDVKSQLARNLNNQTKNLF